MQTQSLRHRLKDIWEVVTIIALVVGYMSLFPLGLGLIIFTARFAWELAGSLL